MEDPGLFTLPYKLGDSKPFSTLADLGSCVNIIPLYLFKILNIRLLEESDHIFGLADGTKSYVKDVEVHIGKLKVLNDFYVINMKKDPETSLLVGRGFLATVNAVIDDENPIRTLGDYSKPSHEGYKNSIEILIGNNVVPLRFDTIWLVQNGCAFHGLWFEDPNQHLKDFLKLVDAGSITAWEDLTTRFIAQFFPLGRTAKLYNDILVFQQHHGESLSKAWTRFKDLLQKVPHHGIDLWLYVQIFYDHVNPATRRTIDQSAGGKLRDHNAKESWALLEDLALYHKEYWNDLMDFAKPVKAITLP
ncbi:zinc finger, CCHC-type containing protein [Tanacetum coccineum]